MLCVCMRACVLGWLGVGWLFVWWPVRVGCVWLLVLCVVNIVAHYVVAVDVVSVSSCVYGCCWVCVSIMLVGCALPLLCMRVCCGSAVRVECVCVIMCVMVGRECVCGLFSVVGCL